MSNYTSENTHILATHMQDGNNRRMMLLHICESGRHEYVIGSYFTAYKEYMDHYGSCDGPAIIADREGNCFTADKHEKVGDANGRWNESFDHPRSKYHYEWDWGHYFSDVVSAVDYWKREVLGESEESDGQ